MTIKSFPDRWAERLAYLASRHITCLDPEWRGSKAKYHFRCDLGHEWSRPGRVLPGRLDCRICDRLEKAAQTCWPAMLEAGRQHGTECLDSRWLGYRHRYRFRCKIGHEWLRTGGSQTKHPTCPECLKQRLSGDQLTPSNLDQMKNLARQRGGLCLSDRYEGMVARYAFRCAQGHEWQTRIGSIRSGSWCPICDEAARGTAMRLTDGLERLQRKAAERGGVCLSGDYLGMAAKYRIRCDQRHEFEISGNKLLLGTWCRHCCFDAKRLSIDHAHDAARAKGGQCLSTVYVNSGIKLIWRCHRGHEWGASLSNVRAGHWCRVCADLARITNRHSKAWLKYGDAGSRKLRKE